MGINTWEDAIWAMAITVASHPYDQYDRIARQVTEVGELGVVEMDKRGYNHKSPIDKTISLFPIGSVNVEENTKELCNRCAECRKKEIV